MSLSMMTETNLKKAIKVVNILRDQMSQEERTTLFGLFKQAQEGDAQGPIPPVHDVDARRRYDAWLPFKGLSHEDAATKYISYVEQFTKKYMGQNVTLEDAEAYADRDLNMHDQNNESKSISNSSQNSSVVEPLESGQKRTYSPFQANGSSAHSVTSTKTQDIPKLQSTLWKQRDVMTGWRERTFKLDGKVLEYFRRSTDAYARGVCYLDTNCKVVRLPPSYAPKFSRKQKGNFFPFAVQHPGSAMPFRLAASTEALRDQWIASLRRAIMTPEATLHTLTEETDSQQLNRYNAELERNQESHQLIDDAIGLPEQNQEPELVERKSTTKSKTKRIREHIPMPREPFGSVIQSSIERLRHLADTTDDWTPNGSKDDVTCWIAKGNHPGARGDGHINYPRRAIRDLLVELERKGETDSSFERGHVVERFDPRSTLTYMRYKAVWPTSARDFSNVTHWQVVPATQEEGGILYVLAVSHAHPECPPVKGLVRAQCILGGWVIRPRVGIRLAKERQALRMKGEQVGPWPTDIDIDSEGCDCTYLVLTDLGGMIPDRIVKRVTSQQSMLVAAVRKVLDKDWIGQEETLKQLPPIRNDDKDEAYPDVATGIYEEVIYDSDDDVSIESEQGIVQSTATKQSKLSFSQVDSKSLERKNESVSSAQAAAEGLEPAVDLSGDTITPAPLPGVDIPVKGFDRPHKFPLWGWIIPLIPVFFSLGYQHIPVQYSTHVTPNYFLICLFVCIVVCWKLLYRAWVGPPSMSIRRKMLLATWTPPSAGNILGALSFDTTKAQQYIQKVYEKHGVKITVTHLVIKALGMALRACPSINGRIVGDEYIEAGSVDISCLVAIDNDSSSTKNTDQAKFNRQSKVELANALIRNVDMKSVVEIAQELSASAKRLRGGKDKDYETAKTLMRLCPVWLIRFIVHTVGYLGQQLGCSIPILGVRRHPFGSATVSAIGSLGLDFAWAPFTPWAHVPILLTVGAVSDSVVAENGQPVVKPTLKVMATLDHRYLDGAHAALLGKVFRMMFEDPDAYMDRVYDLKDVSK